MANLGPMTAAAPGMRQWFVRVRGEVRGPVDEMTVRAWLAGGMLDAELCPAGGERYVPVGKSPLAWADPATQRRRRIFWGIVATIGFSLLVMALRANKIYEATHHARPDPTLPTIGARGVLSTKDAFTLCPTAEVGFRSMCLPAQQIPYEPNSHVQVMKAKDGMCRYWVQDGPRAGVAGDGPCAWFVAQ